MTSLRAPFDADQVRWLNAYQRGGAFHPFTCPERHIGKERVLVAHTEGWFCPSCTYTQDWAHTFMADPRWLRRVGEQPGGVDGDATER